AHDAPRIQQRGDEAGRGSAMRRCAARRTLAPGGSRCLAEPATCGSHVLPAAATLGAMALSTSPRIPDPIARTGPEVLRPGQGSDPSTAGVYEMCRYHLGLDGSGSSGKRMRPLLGLLAYASITGDHRRALPGAAAVELGHNFSLVHDDIEDDDRER